MKNMEKHLAKLPDGAAECEVIAAEATERTESELFVRLSQHLTILADENSTVMLQQGSPSVGGEEVRAASVNLVFIVWRRFLKALGSIRPCANPPVIHVQQSLSAS